MLDCIFHAQSFRTPRGRVRAGRTLRDGRKRYSLGAEPRPAARAAHDPSSSVRRVNWREKAKELKLAKKRGRARARVGLGGEGGARVRDQLEDFRRGATVWSAKRGTLRLVQSPRSSRASRARWESPAVYQDTRTKGLPLIAPQSIKYPDCVSWYRLKPYPVHPRQFPRVLRNQGPS